MTSTALVSPLADMPHSHAEPDNAHLDLRDRALLAEHRAAYRGLTTDAPRVGEFVTFTDGTLRRISHVWEWGNGPESIQTSDGGSYHLSISGHLSMSGSLFSGLAPDLFTLASTDDPATMIRGRVWFWHHGMSGAGRGMDAFMDFRVWTVAQEANR